MTATRGVKDAMRSLLILLLAALVAMAFAPLVLAVLGIAVGLVPSVFDAHLGVAAASAGACLSSRDSVGKSTVVSWTTMPPNTSSVTR